MSTEHLILPVGTRVALIDIMFVGMTVFIVKVSRIGTLLTGILILHQYKFIRVHHIQFIGKRLGLYIGIQADRNTTLRRILGCHQNNAVGSTSTINSCRSGILQYFNRFDIRRRNIIQAVYFKTVENNQRTVVLCRLEPPPRTRILTSASGEPSTVVTCTPGSLPTIASAAEVVCTFSRIFPDTLEIEPVRLPLF